MFRDVNEPSLSELLLFGLGLFKFYSSSARAELKDEPKNWARAHNKSSQAELVCKLALIFNFIYFIYEFNFLL